MNQKNEYIDWGFHCPACGFRFLNNPPYAENGGASYDNCPSCGIEFGYHDDALGISFAEWREKWIKSEMCWSSRSLNPPDDWDAEAQLKDLISESNELE